MSRGRPDGPRSTGAPPGTPARRSARKRKLVEEAFGWAKTIAGLAKVKVRGLARVRFPFVLAMAAYDLVRMPRLLAGHEHQPANPTPACACRPARPQLRSNGGRC